jgi:hypothetical protein
VPAQQRLRRHQPAHPQRRREQPGQGGEYRPVRPIQLRLGGSAAAAPPPPGEALAIRHPSTPKNAPAETSSQPIGRALGRASARSRTRDPASRPTAAAREPAGQPAMPSFGTLQGERAISCSGHIPADVLNAPGPFICIHDRVCSQSTVRRSHWRATDFEWLGLTTRS